MAFKRRKGRSRDPFEHLSRERDSTEEEMPWFLAPEIQEGEDNLNLQAGISSNISEEDLAAPVVRAEATPPEGYPASPATEDPGQTALANLAEADHDALADLAEANHAAVAGLGEAAFEPGIVDQLPSEPFPTDDLPVDELPVDELPLEQVQVEHVPVEQLQEEPLLPVEHLSEEPMPVEQVPVEQDFQLEDDQPEAYTDDTVGPEWPEPILPQPEAVPAQDWTEPARNIEPPPPDPSPFPPPAPPLEDLGEVPPPPQDLLPPPAQPPVPPPAPLMPEQQEPGYTPMPTQPPPSADGGHNVMQDPGFQSLFPEIPDVDGDMAEDGMSEPLPPDDNQRRELTTSFLNVLMNQDPGAQPGVAPTGDPANGQPHDDPQFAPSYDQAFEEGYDQTGQSDAQGPVVPRRPRRRVSRPRGY